MIYSLVVIALIIVAILVLRIKPQEEVCMPIKKRVIRKKLILRKPHKQPQEDI